MSETRCWIGFVDYSKACMLVSCANTDQVCGRRAGRAWAQPSANGRLDAVVLFGDVGTIRNDSVKNGVVASWSKLTPADSSERRRQ